MDDRQRLLDSIKSGLDRLDTDAEEAAAARLRETLCDSMIDTAALIDDFEDDEKVTIFETLEPDSRAELLEELDDKHQSFFFDKFRDQGDFVEALLEMAPDDLADIVDERSEEEREDILKALPDERAQQVRELASYAPETAGGLMTPDFLAVNEETTVQEVKDLIRERGSLESITAIFVVSGARLLGVFSARDLILADNSATVAMIMMTEVIHCDVNDDREEVYRRMETYHLASLPVVDKFHNLVGLITFDDVLTIGEEEASEDVFRMAGSSDIHPTQDSVIGRARKRIPYLMVSLVGGFGTAIVVKIFGVAEAVGEATYFLPLIAMLGGNIATQSSAVMVRGFATGEVNPRRIKRVIGDEIMVGALVGACCALAAFALALCFQVGDPIMMANSVMASLLVLSLVASGLGTAIPAFCNHLKLDPAIAAGPFITMLVDMIGCAVYLCFVQWFQAVGGL